MTFQSICELYGMFIALQSNKVSRSCPLSPAMYLMVINGCEFNREPLISPMDFKKTLIRAFYNDMKLLKTPPKSLHHKRYFFKVGVRLICRHCFHFA